MDAYVTEARAQQRASALSVWVYDFAVADPQQKYKGVAEIVWKWRYANHFMPIVYNESTIVTFMPVVDFAGFVPQQVAQRTLDMSSSFERALLERLVKESFIVTGQQNLNFKRVGSDLQGKTPKKVGKVLIYPALSIHVNIIEDAISIGFDLTHKFEYDYTVQQMLDRGQAVQAGLRVVHSRQQQNGMYTVERLADYGVRDVCPVLKQSIYDYYIERNDVATVKQLLPHVRVLHVQTKDGTRLSYAASVLKPLCSFDTMNTVECVEVMKALKLKPDERMRKSLSPMMKLLSAYTYLSFEKRPFLIEHNGYTLQQLLEPSLQFDRVFRNAAAGLRQGRVYKGGDIHLSIFMDETLEREFYESKKLAYKFVRVLQTIAAQHGVKITISSETRGVSGKFTDLFFEHFLWEVQSLKHVFLGTTVLAFMTKTHLSEVPYAVYDAFKKQFGGKWDLTSQVLTEKSLRDFALLLQQHKLDHFSSDDPAACQHVASIVKNSPMQYTVFNILLGLYVKSGIQPWMLARRTHSDCFIGLDVSHEDGKSAAGIMNVIGCNGQLVKQSAINGALAGEKIDAAMLEEILIDVLQAYTEQFGTLPKHVTIHRDGRWREDMALVERVLAQKNIAYDIVEVIKDASRRMASYDVGKDAYKTQQGVYYVRGKEALLCATNPHERVGMAQPMKIVQKTAALDFAHIVEDAYALSFMHIHALNKTRLPATVHYADLSSTAYQRGQITPRSTNITHLPFV